MNPEGRLADIMTGLEQVGVTALVMGGHAVRFYGLHRNTVDYDLHLAPESWADLSARLQQAPFISGQPLLEGPSWRPAAFRRFQIGTLPSGREEWLEFWHINHLLAPFAELEARCVRGEYGGRRLSFLSLPDLIRSKETERESDWEDIAYLEEFHDADLLRQATADPHARLGALSQVRSRRGFENLLIAGLLNERTLVEQAWDRSAAITQAYLLPSLRSLPNVEPIVSAIEPLLLRRLRAEPPGSALHLALVEIVRRRYKQMAQDADKADKQAIRAAQTLYRGKSGE